MEDALLRDSLMQILQNQGAIMLKLVFIKEDSGPIITGMNNDALTACVERIGRLLERLKSSAEESIKDAP